ncbi:Zona pellucida sperm-binding protein 3 [Liparis tanakae]|uniref:Zona pellucida sperm-binding protein 3 n=1 Tax=Liparis tanakae TaxID=230148 RepID=A0A4Z2IRF0_9TELE|nr:Zona pellucida sperm-binding protein 3 [Liparis tanakae]
MSHISIMAALKGPVVTTPKHIKSLILVTLNMLKVLSSQGAPNTLCKQRIHLRNKSRKYSLSSSSLMPTWIPFMSKQAAEETLVFDLRIMTNDWLHRRGSNVFYLGEPMGFEASVRVGHHTGLRVFVSSCVATLSPDVSSEPRYVFVENGCLVDSELPGSRSRFLSRTQDDKLHLTIDAFKFHNEDREELYITCHLNAVPVNDAEAPNKACSLVNGRTQDDKLHLTIDAFKFHNENRGEDARVGPVIVLPAKQDSGPIPVEALPPGLTNKISRPSLSGSQWRSGLNDNIDEDAVQVSALLEKETPEVDMDPKGAAVDEDVVSILDDVMLKVLSSQGAPNTLYKQRIHLRNQSRKYSLSSSSLMPTWIPFMSKQAAEETLSFDLSIMTNDWLHRRGSNVFYLGEPMGIEASVRVGHHTGLRVFVSSCVATLSPDVSSEPRYVFVENGTQIVSSNNQLPQLASSTPATVSPAAFSLKLMTADWTSETFSPVFYIGELLHLEASYTGPKSGPERLFIDSCVATLSPDTMSVPRYYFIENHGCLTDAKEYKSNALFQRRKSASSLQLQLEAFLFHQDSRNSVTLNMLQFKVLSSQGAPNTLCKQRIHLRNQSRKYSLSSSSLMPTWIPFMSKQAAEETLEFDLRIMSTDWLHRRGSNVFYLGEPMGIEASVRVGHHTGLRVFVSSCVATLSPDVSSEPRYVFVENGCLVDSELPGSRSHFLSRTQDDKLHLTIDAFKFHNENRGELYITCHLNAVPVNDAEVPNKACSLVNGRKYSLSSSSLMPTWIPFMSTQAAEETLEFDLSILTIEDAVKVSALLDKESLEVDLNSKGAAVDEDVLSTLNDGAPNTLYKQRIHLRNQSRKYSLSSSSLMPTWIPFMSKQAAEETLEFDLRIMTNDWLYRRSSNVFYLGEPINFEASVRVGHHTGLRVFVSSCVATLSPDVSSEPRYVFVENGCLVDSELPGSRSHFLSRTQDDKLHLTIDAFKFHNEHKGEVRLYFNVLESLLHLLIASPHLIFSSPSSTSHVT